MLKLETNVTPCILLVANHSDTPLCLMCDAMLQKQKKCYANYIFHDHTSQTGKFSKCTQEILPKS